MPFQSVADISRIVVAFLLFIPLLLLPGYCIAAAADLWRIRTQSFVAQCAISLTLSTAVMPIVTFLLWTRTFALVVALYVTAAALSLILAVHHRKQMPRLALPWSLIAVACAWSVLALASLVDMPAAHGLYPTVLSLDHSFRTEFVAAAARAHTLPPASPFFLDAGRPVPFRYHYFWFMLCGAVSRISAFRIGARDALFASIAWAGLACMALLGLYLKLFFAYKAALRRGLILAGCMSVGGLQLFALVAAAATRLFHGKPPLFWPTLTWINLDGQIPGWIDTFLWVPNHTAAFVAGMAAILLLWTGGSYPLRRALLHTALAGLAVASAVGLSVHVAFTFLIFFGAWALALLIGRRWARAASVVLAVSIAGIAALPYVLLLRSSNTGADHFLHFAVRASVFGEWLSRALHLHGAADQLAALVLQPLVWFFELGFLVLAGLWAWRRTPDAGQRQQWKLLGLLAATALLVTLFLSSGTGTAGTNDLGWRGMLPVQAVLLFCATEYFATGAWKRRGLLRGLMLLLVVIGVGSTLAELATLRFFPLAVDDGLAPHTNPLTMLPAGNGSFIADIRQALEFVRQHAPVSAVVQDNPGVNDSILPGLFAERQTAARGETGYRFGGSAAAYAPVLLRSKKIFADTSQSFAQVRQTCRALGIDDLLVTTSDALWADRSSWIWHVLPAYSNAHARVFACSDESSLR